MPRAGIYARISSDRDGQQLGVRRQLDDCEQLAKRRGWEVIESYIDDDVSAYNGRHRPEYRRMLEDLRSGFIDAVVVWHLDRLHRQPKELEEFFEVCDSAGVRNLASVTGDVDLGNDDGRFMARILGAVARKESDDKSRRIKRKALELAQAGKIGGGGTRPYGYEADRKTIRADEAEVIRECSRRLLAGESLRSVCASLIDRRIPTVSGKEWKPQTLSRILQSGRISGQREHHRELIADAEWPGIIDPSETARIRAIFADPSRRTNRTARRYLLLRLLRCGLCGETLIARPKAGGVRGYHCATGPGFTGCGHISAIADSLEAFVVEAVLYRLDSPELAAALRSSSDDLEAVPWQQELDEAQFQLDELAKTYGEQAITLSEWLAARKPIERRLSAAKKRLAERTRASAVTEHIGNASQLRDLWADLPLTRQRAIVAAVLDHVVVDSARRGYNRFDPDRFRPIWRV
jgi:site-specific DNA recombinase